MSFKCLCHSQGDVVGDSLGFYEVLGLVLSDYMPTDSIVDTILQEHSSVDCVSLIQSYITAVCLGRAANLQHEHDLTAGRRKKERKEMTNNTDLSGPDNLAKIVLQ